MSAPERISVKHMDAECDWINNDIGEVEYIRADLVPQWQPIETWKLGTPALFLQPPCHSGRMKLNARIITSDQSQGLRETTHWMPLPGPP